MPKEVKWAISLAIGLGLLFLGWKFYFVLVLLHIMVCGLLIVVVLLQSGEAADLAGAFGGAGSQTAFGPRGAATFLSKATTWCAIMFMLTSMTLTMHQNSVGAGSGSSILQQFSTTPKQAPPVAPAPTAPAPAATPTIPAPATPAPAPAK
jgi:preprotein translocase subunit SecG